MISKSSPYLSSDDRLGDVIAAIQAMGTYKFYKLEFKSWAKRISGDELQADHWKRVFEEHPEFFRLDGVRERSSLVWRRQRQKLYDVDKEKDISRGEAEILPAEQRARLSRLPLKSDEIGMLINTAINLHARALEHRQDTRWWIAALLSVVSAVLGFLGALAGGVVTALVKVGEVAGNAPPVQ